MKNKVLVLRTCKADLTSCKGFQWPESGPVECLDWNPKKECGGGLHGHLWGGGAQCLLDFLSDAKWLVVEVEATDIVDLGSKVKFPRGNVVFCGSRVDATQYIYQRAPKGTLVHGLRLAVGDNEVAASGVYGTSTSDFEGTSTSGDWGTSTSGDFGTSASGRYGTSTSGFKGTSTSGERGTSTSGEYGTIQIKYWDDAARRYKLKTGYIGEDGLLPDTPYKLDSNNNFVKA